MTSIIHYASPLGGMLLAAKDGALTGAWFDGQRFFARNIVYYSILPKYHVARRCYERYKPVGILKRVFFKCYVRHYWIHSLSGSFSGRAVYSYMDVARKPVGFDVGPVCGFKDTSAD